MRTANQILNEIDRAGLRPVLPALGVVMYVVSHNGKTHAENAPCSGAGEPAVAVALLDYLLDPDRCRECDFWIPRALTRRRDGGAYALHTMLIAHADIRAVNAAAARGGCAPANAAALLKKLRMHASNADRPSYMPAAACVTMRQMADDATDALEAVQEAVAEQARVDAALLRGGPALLEDTLTALIPTAARQYATVDRTLVLVAMVPTRPLPGLAGLLQATFALPSTPGTCLLRVPRYAVDLLLRALPFGSGVAHVSTTPSASDELDTITAHLWNPNQPGPLGDLTRAALAAREILDSAP